MQFFHRNFRVLLLALALVLLYLLWGYSQNGRYRYERGRVLDTRTGEVQRRK